MEGLKIIEYDPSYAKAVAEMWVKSADGFNGEHSDETEESVLATHANSSNINTYLAVIDDKVLGYCAYTKYLKDEGAMHISLLAARCDYHGKGIGKALVKKAIERTTELKYPRLDLYTWPANTKAIPLYKKCGYFFENRQDTIHLMNFIPTVINTEAVKDYFKAADWYDDMKRTINMNPDGRYENGFDFYEYKWEKNDRNLRMEFERKGRGLRLIETDDYKISLSAPYQNLIFGRSYKATYEIINKTGKPLNIEIAGKDDKNIKFSFYKKINVVEKEILESDFYISEIEAEYGSFKTHPGVVSDIVINGKKALFKLGIVPKFPGKIAFACDDIQRYSGECFNMHIDIESYLNENGIFEFELPEHNDISFLKKSFKIETKKGEKVSVPVKCSLLKPCIYQAQLNIKVALESGDSVQFKKNAGAIFSGQDSALGGEVNDKYTIINGAYRLTLDKNYNNVEIYAMGKKKDSYIIQPKLGMPFSDEFSSMIPKNVKWHFEDGKMLLSGDYISSEFKDITVRTIFKLSNNGLLEHFYKVINTSKVENPNDIYIRQAIHTRLDGASIPYENKIIYDTEPSVEYPGYYIGEKISENWIFANREEETESLIWPEYIKPEYNGWFINFNHSIGKIKGGEEKTTEPIYLALSTFKNLKEARKFALKSNSENHIDSSLGFEVDINNGNPFVNQRFNINVVENREFSYDGKIVISSKNNSFDEVHVDVKDKVKKVSIPIHAEKDFEKDFIYIKSNLGTVSYERKAHVFYVKNNEFKSELIEENEFHIYSVNNGIMEVKSSPEFSTGIFSLQFMGRECLDNDFPNIAPRTWYNPWLGGIQNLPEEFIENAGVLLKEQTKVNFTEKHDNMGNNWRGIKTSMCFSQTEEYKGLEINQYFLMLPGVSVLLNIAELTNNTNRYISNDTFTNAAFLKMGDEVKNNWVSAENYQGDINRYRPGVRDYEIYPKASLLYGCDNLDYKLQVYTDFSSYVHNAYLNTKDLVCFNSSDISLYHGQKKLMPPIFYILTKDHIEDKLLNSFRNIRFE